MKSLEEIKRNVKKGDYRRTAEIVGCSSDLVRMVVEGDRTDHHGIQKILSETLELRERHAVRAERERQKHDQQA